MLSRFQLPQTPRQVALHTQRTTTGWQETRPGTVLREGIKGEDYWYDGAVLSLINIIEW